MKLTPVLHGTLVNALYRKSQVNLPLLHHLQRRSQNGTAQVGLLDPETTGEAVDPAGNNAGIRDKGTFVLLVGDNFSQLNLDIFGVPGLSTKSAEGSGCIVKSSSLDKITGRVW